MAETIPKRNRIGLAQGGLMVGVFIAIDGIQGLLTTGLIGVFLNSLIGIFAWLSFVLWFKLNGVNFLDGKIVLKTVTMWGAGLVEIMPLINNLPAWTVAVVAMLIIVKGEDVIYNKTGK